MKNAEHESTRMHTNFHESKAMQRKERKDRRERKEQSISDSSFALSALFATHFIRVHS
jgi:hypothetical protein